MTPSETLIKQLNDLLNCNLQCNECMCQRQDEGDEESWCGVDSVLRIAISTIEYLNRLDQ